jgi:hypothetical protein
LTDGAPTFHRIAERMFVRGASAAPVDQLLGIGDRCLTRLEPQDEGQGFTS